MAEPGLSMGFADYQREVAELLGLPDVGEVRAVLHDFVDNG